MESFLTFLNQHSGALMVIFTAVVTISTLVYAILTGLLVSETKKMRQIQTEPKIEVILKAREEFINMVNIYIKNMGLGPAYNIAFEIEVEAGGEGAKRLIEDFTRSKFFQTGLKYLGPGQEIISGYSQMTDMFEQKVESILNFVVRYKGATDKSYTEKYRIDLAEFKGRSQLGEPHFYSISKSLKKIQEDFNHLATGFRRIKVDIYTSDDRERENEEKDKYIEELKRAKKEEQNTKP